MTNSLRIAIDAMGGDLGVTATIPAVLALSSQYPTVHFQLYGEPSICASHLPARLNDNVSLLPADQSVSMDDSPVSALRHKRDSSMSLMLNAVAKGEVAACISAGNTGALVAMSLHHLTIQEGYDRPALCQAVPTVNGHSYVLDLGATVDCSADQLVQFARLGAQLSQTLDNNQSPTIRLLNIGSEDYKGTAAVQAAAKNLLEIDELNYQGFIEGDQIYQGLADVIVCDGFAGNIALKTSEGVSRFMGSQLRKQFTGSIYGRLMGLLSKPLLSQWRQSMNPDRYNGAYLLGLNGLVVKSHGGADSQQFAYALEMLIRRLNH